MSMLGTTLKENLTCEYWKLIPSKSDSRYHIINKNINIKLNFKISSHRDLPFHCRKNLIFHNLLRCSYGSFQPWCLCSATSRSWIKKSYCNYHFLRRYKCRLFITFVWMIRLTLRRYSHFFRIFFKNFL